MNEIRKQMTAAEFAALNDIEVDQIQDFTDACVGAQELQPNTMLEIVVDDGEIRVFRHDNKWNDGIDVISGNAENWNW